MRTKNVTWTACLCVAEAAGRIEEFDFLCFGDCENSGMAGDALEHAG